MQGLTLQAAEAAGVSIPLPNMQTVAIAIIFFLAGMAVPTYYGIERLNGFGRAMAAKLPYKPPPGLDEEQALRRAVPDTTDDMEDEDAEGDGAKGDDG